METEGILQPDTVDEAHDAYEGLAPVAKTVVKESAKAMEFDEEEFGERISEDVVATAHDALFASLLVVRVGTAEEFEEWAEQTDHEIELIGSENVDNVVWHAAPFAETAVAATYQDEREAAVATLRRQAYGRIYREAMT